MTQQKLEKADKIKNNLEKIIKVINKGLLENKYSELEIIKIGKIISDFSISTNRFDNLINTVHNPDLKDAMVKQSQNQNLTKKLDLSKKQSKGKRLGIGGGKNKSKKIIIPTVKLKKERKSGDSEL